jgi:hypothetical protein
LATRATDETDIGALSAALAARRNNVDFTRFLRDVHCFDRSGAACSRSRYRIGVIGRTLTLNRWPRYVYIEIRAAEQVIPCQSEPVVEVLATCDRATAGSRIRERILCTKDPLLSQL